jgi:hypothetical protein
MCGNELPARVIEQRVRNRIIEYLSLAASFQQQRAYQASVPAISVPNEVINQWQDWVSEQSFPGFGPPVFTSNELAALAAFGRAWEQVARNTPSPLPPVDETVALPQWEHLRAAAEAAREVFEQRGRLPEDEPI